MRLPVTLLIALLPLAFGGCASSEQLHPVPIAGGKMLGIGPNSNKANGYQILQAVILPGTVDRQLYYEFTLGVPPDTNLKRVQVDDISDEQGSQLIDDPNPWQENRLWHAKTSPLAATDPLLKWVLTVTPSMRVYRFTVTDAAGRKTVLYQVAPFPDWMKSSIRQKLGEKY
jgi:hypothetical protein